MFLSVTGLDEVLAAQMNWRSEVRTPIVFEDSLAYLCRKLSRLLLLVWEADSAPLAMLRSEHVNSVASAIEREKERRHRRAGV